MKKATIWLLILFFLSSCTRTDTSESRAQGLVEGDVLTLKAMVSGSIEEVHLAEGKRINNSDLLVRINTDKINNQLLELEIARREIRLQAQNLRQKINMADADIAHLKKQVARFRRLAEKQSIPGENLETMELRLLLAETSRYDILKSLEILRVQADKLDNKQQYLELLSKDHLIISPVDGVVIERFVSPGENVFPGTPVADILDESSLYVEMFIEEVELAGLKL
ncbi:HlyD family secretion protein, partial [Acidobacteriota bacterium]